MKFYFNVTVVGVMLLISPTCVSVSVSVCVACVRVYTTHHFLICCEILTSELEIECMGTCRVLGDACMNLLAGVMVKHGRMHRRRVTTGEGSRGGTGDSSRGGRVTGFPCVMEAKPHNKGVTSMTRLVQWFAAAFVEIQIQMAACSLRFSQQIHEGV